MNERKGCPRCQPQKWIVEKEGPRKTYLVQLPGGWWLIVCERCDPFRATDQNQSIQFREDPCFQGAI